MCVYDNNKCVTAMYYHNKPFISVYKSILTVFLSERGRRLDLCGAESWGISPKLETLITVGSSKTSPPLPLPLPSFPLPVIPERIFWSVMFSEVPIDAAALDDDDDDDG